MIQRFHKRPGCEEVLHIVLCFGMSLGDGGVDLFPATESMDDFVSILDVGTSWLTVVAA